MVSIVKMYNKKSGVTYVYESESYWDKEKQQPRNRRKLIGKLDPETGEVVPTGKKGPRPSSAGIKEKAVPAAEDAVKSDDAGARELLRQKDDEIAVLKKKVKLLESRCAGMEETIGRIRSLTDGFSER